MHLVRNNSKRDLESELGSAVLDACRVIWHEFAELSQVAPESFPEDEQQLLTWYSEVYFRFLNHRARCSQCRAHVRHALPVAAEMRDGTVQQHDCLCTRCLVAIEHEADRMWWMVGDRRVEHQIRARREHRARSRAA